MAPKATKPKKPQNAYWLWVMDHKEELFKACGTNSIMQCGEEAGKQWKALGAAGQAPFKKKYEELKAQYDKDMEAFAPKGKAATAPKRKRNHKENADGKAAEAKDEAGEEGPASKKQKRTAKNPGDLPGKLRKLQYLLMVESKSAGGFQKVLEKFDKDHNGSLDEAEFTELLRIGLGISEEIIPDTQITDLIAALDADASGTLDAAEIQAFIDGGNDTFSAASTKQQETMKRLQSLNKPGKLPKLQYLLMIEARSNGGFHKVLAQFDKDQSGTLDEAEFKDLVRTGLNISVKVISDSQITDLVAALDDDGSGTLDVAEVHDFIERGEETFFSGPNEGHVDVSDIDKHYEDFHA